MIVPLKGKSVKSKAKSKRLPSGDYYGTAIRQKVGTFNSLLSGQGSASKNNTKKPPNRLA